MVSPRARPPLPLLVAAAVTVLGCGYSEQEWQAQLDKYNRAVSKEQAAERKILSMNAELEAAGKRVSALEADLEAAGVDLAELKGGLSERATQLGELSARLEERERALAAYKQRAEQLGRVRARFAQLKQQLSDVAALGLDVTIRRNRMVISLPGDVLFAAGRDQLQPGGVKLLDKVASIINADPTLKGREYQVAAHTDNQARRGRFTDNWALSLMQARQVLLYLIDEKRGGLPVNRWNAAGFADTDPISSNETEEGRQLNRRCEIMVVPSTEEMLDLRHLAAG